MSRNANEPTIPVAVSESTITMFGVQLRVVVLNDGRRVINAEDMHALLSGLGMLDLGDVQPGDQP